MSPSVHVFLRDDIEQLNILDEHAGVSYLAGFEAWRHHVWGSERVCALGAEPLPQLAQDDPYIEHEHVEQFQRECQLLCENLEIVEAGTDSLNPKATYVIASSGHFVDPPDPHAVFRETVSRRLANIDAAVQWAINIGDRVMIW